MRAAHIFIKKYKEGVVSQLGVGKSLPPNPRGCTNITGYNTTHEACLIDAKFPTSCYVYISTNLAGLVV